MLFSKKNELSGLKDEELINRYRYSGDKRYVGELYKRYTHLVLGVSMKYLKNQQDAKDMTMQIFEKLIHELRKHNVDYFKGWLFTVVRNSCLMQLRKQKSAQEQYELFKGNIQKNVESDGQLHLDDAIFKEAQLSDLERAIEMLKAEQKICIKLFYLENKSYQDVAIQTGFNLKQVKSFIQNGKRNLKNYLIMNNGEAG